MFRAVAALVFSTAFMFAPTVSHVTMAAAAPFCALDQPLAFTPGFADLAAKLGNRMGAPLECEHRDSSDPNRVVQQTTAGWNLYYFDSNMFAFTNGYQIWVQAGDRFVYSKIDPTTRNTGVGIPAFTDADCAVNPQATGPGLAEYCFTVYADAKIAELARLKQATQEAQASLAATTAAQSPAFVPAPLGGVVESQIDGEFTGWDGNTVFPLTNGQIWVQSTYAYHYHYAYRPRVLIYPSNTGWRLQVDGDSDSVQVSRVQ